MQPPMSPSPPGHVRNQSLADLRPVGLGRSDSRRLNGARNGSPAGTFAPQFIKQEGLDGADDKVRGIEGENDFTGKRYVWLRDDEKAFVKGWIVDELAGDVLKVQCDDGSVSARRSSVVMKLLIFDSNVMCRPTASTR